MSALSDLMYACKLLPLIWQKGFSMEFFREVTPLKNQDICVVLDSVNNGFDYPIHNHPEYELNLILGTSGTRIVGDSTEKYTQTDLVFLGPYLPHKWDGELNKTDEEPNYRVITIQFAMDLFSSPIFNKDRFQNIRELLARSSRGIVFNEDTIQQVAPVMDQLTKDNGFSNVIHFLRLMDMLAKAKTTRMLSSEIKTNQAPNSQHKRIQVAYNYIMMNYTRVDFTIQEIASQLNMSDSAFSHFFKKNTFRSFSSFLCDLRLSNACKLLLSSDYTISQICSLSGFNNVSNFNRLFKKYRNTTPKDYKAQYQEKSSFDWTEQVTPWQFIPKKEHSDSYVLPDSYSTSLIHV